MGESVEAYLARTTVVEDWQDAAVGSRDPQQYAMQQRAGLRPDGLTVEQYAILKADGQSPSGHLAPLSQKERTALRGVLVARRLHLIERLRSDDTVEKIVPAAQATVTLHCAIEDRTRWYRDGRIDR